MELERASFEVERFQAAGDERLEVIGRWSGIRGRRFVRPTLTAMAEGREQRSLALLDHKPWTAEEGESWVAVFPWSADLAALVEAELTVAPDVTVPLPPLSSSSAAGRRRAPRGRAPSTPRAGKRPAIAARGVDGDGANDVERAGNDGPGQSDPSLRSERDAAQSSLEQAASELKALKRDHDRLRVEHREALAARERDLSERHDAIEAEVGLRIADLRAEVERERAAAGLAAQSVRERDAARSGREEAIRERDEARAERDAARHQRNRMLAERDAARTRAEETRRSWEVAAARGTRRTQERDAMAIERDRLARERDAAVGHRDRKAAQHEAALARRERAVGEREVTLTHQEVTLAQREATLAGLQDTLGELGTTLTGRETALAQGGSPAIAGSAALGDSAQRPVESGDQTSERDKSSSREEGEVTLLDLPSQPRKADPGTAHSGEVAEAGVPSRRRPRLPPAPASDRTRGAGARPRSNGVGGGLAEASPEVWRMRLLAAAALLVAIVVLVVIALAS